MRPSILSAFACVALVAIATAAAAQSTDGSAVFESQCASCHNGAEDSRAPEREQLLGLTPESIVDALTGEPCDTRGSRSRGRSGAP